MTFLLFVICMINHLGFLSYRVILMCLCLIGGEEVLNQLANLSKCWSVGGL